MVGLEIVDEDDDPIVVLLLCCCCCCCCLLMIFQWPLNCSNLLLYFELVPIIITRLYYYRWKMFALFSPFWLSLCFISPFSHFFFEENIFKNDRVPTKQIKEIKREREREKELFYLRSILGNNTESARGYVSVHYQTTFESEASRNWNHQKTYRVIGTKTHDSTDSTPRLTTLHCYFPFIPPPVLHCYYIVC